MDNDNTKIQDTVEYWNKRYADGQTSGDGSYGAELIHKLQLLDNLGITSISEIGCGDFNLGKHLLELYPKGSYVGQDISDVIIAKNRATYPYTFTTNRDELPQADLLVCMDVLFHVIKVEDYEKLLEEIKSKWTKYLALSAYETEQVTSPHLSIRAFDYMQFGTPIIRKVVEEDGQKYMYLWRK